MRIFHSHGDNGMNGQTINVNTGDMSVQEDWCRTQLLPEILESLDVMTVEVREIYARFVYFEASLQCQQSGQADVPLRVLSVTSVLMNSLLRTNSQLYAGFGSPQNYHAMHLMAKKFTMPEQLCFDGVNHFHLWLRQHSAQTTADLKTFIHNAAESFSLLHQVELSLLSEWTQCQADLHRYLLALDEGGIDTPSTVSIDGGSSEYNDRSTPSRYSLSPGSSVFGIGQPSSILSEDINLEELIPGVSHDRKNTLSNCDVWNTVWHGIRMAPTTLTALAGWIYYGKSLASSFTIYVRVFIRLVQTGLWWE